MAHCVGGNHLAAITNSPRRTQYKTTCPTNGCAPMAASEKSSRRRPPKAAATARCGNDYLNKHIDAHNATVSPPSSHSITTNPHRSFRSSPCFFCDDGGGMRLLFCGTNVKGTISGCMLGNHSTNSTSSYMTTRKQIDSDRERA